MHKLVAGIIVASVIVTPAQAADWRSQPVETQQGAFVGARLRVPLGGSRAAQPQASLTIAPTTRSISTDGTVRTRIGEGVALAVRPDTGVTLNLGGIRADRSLGLKPSGSMPSGKTHNMSDEAKVALGVGAVLIVAVGVGYLVLSNRCTECDQ